MHEQLQDLLLPVKASGFGIWLWLALVLLLICILSLWYWNKYRYSAYILAHRKLQKLKTLPDKTLKNSRSIALELSSLLCLSFDVKHLSQYQTEHILEWNKFHEKLNKACYSSTREASARRSVELLSEAEIWLKRER